jgi:hypothetical protein
MNEPHFGFVGHQNLDHAENFMIPGGPRPSPWQSICAASGYTVKVPVYNIIGKNIKHYETLNPEGISLFKESHNCPWKQAGVWKDEDGAPKLLRADHFSKNQGRMPNFADDFLKPFIVKYINTMKEADENSFFFIEGMPHATMEDSHPSWDISNPSNAINAFHWYDGLALFTKSFRSWFTMDPDTAKIILGRKNVSAFFAGCLEKGIRWTREKMGNTPCLLGEFGLAFDLNNRSGMKKGDYSVHEQALSMYYDAVDANLLHSTIWNYTASNTKKYGDGWNDEDLSIFTEGKERAAAGWKRPYPMATAGRPLLIKWDRKRGEFIFRFDADGKITAPGLIYLPAETFGTAPKIKAHTLVAAATPVRWEYNHEEQRLLIYNDGYSGEAELKIRLK